MTNKYKNAEVVIDNQDLYINTLQIKCLWHHTYTLIKDVKLQKPEIHNIFAFLVLDLLLTLCWDR